jgi:hypothetical protein
MGAKEDYELPNEVHYWAGRLAGHDDNYEIAKEIVKALGSKFTKQELQIIRCDLSSVIRFNLISEDQIKIREGIIKKLDC